MKVTACIVALFAVLTTACLLFAHYTPPAPPSPYATQEPIFIQGEKVDLVLGGQAQVLRAHKGFTGPEYQIRVKTLNGLQSLRIMEFELYLPPQAVEEVENGQK
jgi:hypothetical protein